MAQLQITVQKDLITQLAGTPAEGQILPEAERRGEGRAVPVPDLPDQVHRHHDGAEAAAGDREQAVPLIVVEVVRPGGHDARLKLFPAEGAVDHRADRFFPAEVQRRDH